jgi:hypothetical protein
MTEIDSEHFCPFPSRKHCEDLYGTGDHNWNCGMCPHKLRKWPTPEQFKKEYSRKPDGLLRWYLCKDGDEFVWADEYEFLEWNVRYCNVEVVACTPYGKPPADWRPE